MKKTRSKLEPGEETFLPVKGAVEALVLWTPAISDDGDDLGDRERSTKKPRSTPTTTS